MISFEPLWQTMKEKGFTTYKLIKEYDINPNTITILKHNRNISTYTLDRLCIILDCTPNDVIKIVKDEKGQQ